MYATSHAPRVTRDDIQLAQKDYPLLKPLWDGSTSIGQGNGLQDLFLKGGLAVHIMPDRSRRIYVPSALIRKLVSHAHLIQNHAKASKAYQNSASGGRQGTGQTLGSEDTDTLVSVRNLAGLLHGQGKLAEAEALYRRALQGMEKTLGAMNPDTLALGSESTLGAEHPDTLVSVSNLAGLLHDRGKLAVLWTPNEALDRLQEGFKNPPKVDNKEAEENANVQIGDDLVEPEPGSLHRGTRLHGGLERPDQRLPVISGFKTHVAESKTGSVPMDIDEKSSPKSSVSEEVKGDLLDHKYSRLNPTGKLWFYDLQIPERIWDILLDSDFPFEFIGAPPYDKVTRGKKNKKMKPDSEARHNRTLSLARRLKALVICRVGGYYGNTSFADLSDLADHGKSREGLG
eukprot:g63205.t1